MKSLRSLLVKTALMLTTGTALAVDLCPNIWSQLTGKTT